MRGPSASDASISLASTITIAINQRAKARLVALDIKGAFDSVWWKGLLAHLWSVGFRGKAFQLLNHIYPIVISELLYHRIPRTYILLLLEILMEQYGPLPYLIYISAKFLMLWSTL